MSAAVSLAFMAGCFATLAVIAIILCADVRRYVESALYDDEDGGAE